MWVRGRCLAGRGSGWRAPRLQGRGRSRTRSESTNGGSRRLETLLRRFADRTGVVSLSVRHGDTRATRPQGLDRIGREHLVSARRDGLLASLLQQADQPLDPGRDRPQLDTPEAKNQKCLNAGR